MFARIRHSIQHSWRKLRTPRYLRGLADHQEGRIAITGCGRSGTNYTAEVFRGLGYALGHECFLRHGISSWCLAPQTSLRHLGPSPRDIAPLDVPYVHQVRHPLRVIASMATAGADSWRFIARFIPIAEGDSLRLKCMKYWYYWNLLAEQRAQLTYRVEDIETELPKVFEIGGFDVDRFDPQALRRTRKDVNRREHAAMTWDDLRDEDAELAERVRELARKYGYQAD